MAKKNKIIYVTQSRDVYTSKYIYDLANSTSQDVKKIWVDSINIGKKNSFRANLSRLKLLFNRVDHKCDFSFLSLSIFFNIQLLKKIFYNFFMQSELLDMPKNDARMQYIDTCSRFYIPRTGVRGYFQKHYLSAFYELAKERAEIAFTKQIDNEIELWIPYTTYLTNWALVQAAVNSSLSIRTFGCPEAFGKYINKKYLSHTLASSDLSQACLNEKFTLNKLKFSYYELQSRTSGKYGDHMPYMKELDIKGLRTVNVHHSPILFLHKLSDAVHGYPENIFNSNKDWIETTIQILEARQQRYFVKIHPNEDNASLVLKYLNKMKYGKTINSNLPVASVKNISFGITRAGSIAAELAFLGVPIVCCADAPYSKMSFAYKPETINEYRDILIKGFSTNEITRRRWKIDTLKYQYKHTICNQGLGPQAYDKVLARNFFSKLYK